MLEELNGVTSQFALLALDAASKRHEIIANNIANVNTEGYTAKYVDFERQLADLMNAGHSTAENAFQLEHIDVIRQRLQAGELVKQSESDTVNLDTEMVKLSQNAIHYQSILQALKGRSEILRMAISEGR